MADKLARWNELDLPALLNLSQTGPMRYCNRHGDANLNGRSYGGQSLGQAMMAAALSVPSDRAATALQFTFLQGSVPDEAIDFDVTALQDGKRFSSRHVRGMQHGKTLFDVQASFALPLAAPEHETPTRAHYTAPEELSTLSDMPASYEAALRCLGGYSSYEKACMDFRLPDIAEQLAVDATTTEMRFWIKVRHPLPGTRGMHASAFAYLSDWWLNFSSLKMHVGALDHDRRLYISSLNHCIWFHRPFAADEWLHFDVTSPCAAQGRGLSVARIHDRTGRLVASATQECLMAYA